MRHRTQRFTSAVAVSRFNLPRKLIPFGINSIAFHLQLRRGDLWERKFRKLADDSASMRATPKKNRPRPINNTRRSRKERFVSFSGNFHDRREEDNMQEKL